MTEEVFVVLLVEDNPDHAELVIRGFENQRVTSRIEHVADGEAALDYLFRRGDYIDPEKTPKPHVILLDLKLPRVGGLEVLKEIKRDPDLRKVPVVVLTTSSSENDIDTAYSNYTNSYLVKPLDAFKFTELMQSIGFYWLGWNCKPW